MDTAKITALKKFMDVDLVDEVMESSVVVAKPRSKNFDSIDELYAAHKQDEFDSAEPIPRLSDKEIRIGRKGNVLVAPERRKLRNRDAETVAAMRAVVDAVEKIADRPINIDFRPEIKPPNVTIQPANVEAPVVNVEVEAVPAPVVKPVIRVEASKDTNNVMSAVKDLGEIVKGLIKQGPPQVEVNVESEMRLPDYEEEIEKVVERDSLNRIMKTVATKRIVHKG